MAYNKSLRVNLTEQEHEFLVERAKDEGMTISEYVNYCVLYESILAGKRKAITVFAKRFSKKFIDVVAMRGTVHDQT